MNIFKEAKRYRLKYKVGELQRLRAKRIKLEGEARLEGLKTQELARIKAATGSPIKKKRSKSELNRVFGLSDRYTYFDNIK